MRTKSRILAFKTIFASLFNDEEEISLENFEDEETLPEKDKEFAVEIANQFFLHKQEIQQSLSAMLENYEIGRLFRVDLALILLGMAEIKYMNTPKPVAINEVVELAKKFGAENSPKFVNGVLAKVE